MRWATGAVVAVSDGRGVIDANPTTAILAIAVVVAAVLVIGRVWRSTAPRRPEVGEATMELRDEPPAVVDLLTGGFRVDDDAVPATVVDLAQRGWFSIEEVGGRVGLRLPSRPPDDGLAGFEERIVRHVRAHDRGGGVVPAPVLTLGPDGVSQRWFRGFVRQVNADARDRGLCLRRWDLRHLAIAWGLVAAAWIVVGLAIATADRTDDPARWATIPNLLLGLALVAALGLTWLTQRITRSDDQRDTPAGLAAAGHWLAVRRWYREQGNFADKPAASVAIWDRHLAYATAMGLAPTVERQFPFETEHDRRAWSHETGVWRRVSIRYQSLVPGWGDHPGGLALRGALQAVVFGALAYGGWYVAAGELGLDDLSDAQRRWIGLAGLVVAILGAIGAAQGAGRALLGVVDLIPRRDLTGTVVRRREYRRWHRLPRPLQWLLFSGRDAHGLDRDAQRRRTWHLAIDTGDDDSIVAHRVRREIHDQVRQGARVRARVSPTIGYVASIEVLSPPPRSATYEPGVPHELITDTSRRAQAAIADRVGGLDAAMARLEDAVDADGSPVLDEVDDEGVTLRERMAESRAELDRLRGDPRIAANPLARAIFDTLAGDGRDDADRASRQRDDDGSADPGDLDRS